MRRRTRMAVVAAGAIAAALFGAPAFAGDPGSDPVATGAFMPQVDDNPFSSLVGKRRAREDRHADGADIERYVTANGERTFLLENHDGRARIKFLCGHADPRLECRIDPEGPAEEIYLLSAGRGSRGDLVFTNSVGDTVLRIAAHGGATVTWPGEAQGMGAYKSFGDDRGALDLPEAGRRTAYRRAHRAAAHISALTGQAVLFDIGGGRDDAPTQAMARAPRRLDRPEPAGSAESEEDARLAPPSLASSLASSPASSFAPAGGGEETGGEETGGEEAGDGDDFSQPERGRRRGRDASVLADAVARVAGGLHLVADDPTGARVIGARISAVRFMEAETPALSLDGRTLVVAYNPHRGLAGRLSSSTVARFLEDTL